MTPRFACGAGWIARSRQAVARPKSTGSTSTHCRISRSPRSSERLVLAQSSNQSPAIDGTVPPVGTPPGETLSSLAIATGFSRHGRPTRRSKWARAYRQTQRPHTAGATIPIRQVATTPERPFTRADPHPLQRGIGCGTVARPRSRYDTSDSQNGGKEPAGLPSERTGNTEQVADAIGTQSRGQITDCCADGQVFGPNRGEYPERRQEPHRCGQVQDGNQIAEWMDRSGDEANRPHDRDDGDELADLSRRPRTAARRMSRAISGVASRLVQVSFARSPARISGGRPPSSRVSRGTRSGLVTNLRNRLNRIGPGRWDRGGRRRA